MRPLPKHFSLLLVMVSGAHAFVLPWDMEFNCVCSQSKCLSSFCLQATNRMHPQTVTGAYLSGIREVCRMLELQSNDV